MKLKRLFADDAEKTLGSLEYYLHEGTELDRLVSAALHPILTKYMAEGFSPREVEAIACNAVAMIVLEYRM